MAMACCQSPVAASAATAPRQLGTVFRADTASKLLSGVVWWCRPAERGLLVGARGAFCARAGRSACCLLPRGRAAASGIGAQIASHTVHEKLQLERAHK